MVQIYQETRYELGAIQFKRRRGVQTVMDFGVRVLNNRTINI